MKALFIICLFLFSHYMLIAEELSLEELEEPQNLEYDATSKDNNRSALNEAFIYEKKENSDGEILFIKQLPVPEPIFTDQVFAITYQILLSDKKLFKIRYKSYKNDDCRFLSNRYERKIDNLYYYDTFYATCSKSYSTLPRLDINIVNRQKIIVSQHIEEEHHIRTRKLNPKKDFSYLFANDFKIKSHIASSFTAQKDIIIFKAESNTSNIKNFKLFNVDKQGFQEQKRYGKNINFSYYFVVPKGLNNYSFSYFNQRNNKYQTVKIPIVIIDQKISTQSDLAPVEKKFNIFKIAIAVSIIIFFFIVFFLQRQIIYVIIAFIPIAYLINTFLPAKMICIKEESHIMVLPTKGATVFKKIEINQKVESIGSIENYTKIRLKNKKIGWVENENICQD